MKYKTVQEAATQWAVSERIVRRYCTEKRIPGAVQINRSWRIPVNAVKPGMEQIVNQPLPKLLRKLISQRKRHGSHGLYDYVQINMAYSNSRMASNRLPRNLVTHLYETDRVAKSFEDVKVNDIIEVRNHFVVMDMLLDEAMLPLSSNMVLRWQRQLLSESCRHKRKSAIETGYRTTKCTLHGKQTTPPIFFKKNRSQNCVRVFTFLTFTMFSGTWYTSTATQYSEKAQRFPGFGHTQVLQALCSITHGGPLTLKSKHEHCYDHFIITRLCAMDLTIRERVKLVHQFFQNSQVYYEQLCDHLYYQAVGETSGQSLWLTVDGQSYLSEADRDPSDLCLMPASDCPPFQDDIKEQFEMICQVMQLSGSITM